MYNYSNETIHVDHPTAGEWRAEVRGLLKVPQGHNGASNAVVLVNP